MRRKKGRGAKKEIPLRGFGGGSMQKKCPEKGLYSVRTGKRSKKTTEEGAKYLEETSDKKDSRGPGTPSPKRRVQPLAKPTMYP